MRDMRVVLAGLVLAGCNGMFELESTELGPDVDQDDVIDGLDSCVAGYIDQFGDYDNDKIPNNEDPCPIDGVGVAPTTDMDTDGVPDVCDPEPNDPGDRVRCPMLFSNADLDVRMWHTRTGDDEWDLERSGLFLVSTGTLASITTDTTIEAPGRTTFDIVGSMYNATGPGAAVFRVFVRSRDIPSESDLGCEFVAEETAAPSSIRVTGIPPQPPVTISATINSFRLFVSFDSSGSIRCVLRNYFGTTLLKAEATGMEVPEGNVAFEGDQRAEVNSLIVYER